MDSGEGNDIFSEKENHLSNEPFGSFEFQNKLTAIVEELRLKRKLEEENENTIKCLLDEKYRMERKLEEQQRLHQNEKVLLEEMIAQLKKTIEDGFCISNDEKEKQQAIIQSFQQEIRALKDEARVQYAEKLNQEKKVQELEGKLKLCNTFQESTIRQVSDIRQHTKSLMQYCQDLFKMQEELKKNVSHATSVSAEYQISTEHLLQTVSIMKKKNSSLKQEVISLRTQLQLQKDLAGASSRAIKLLDSSEPLKGLHNVLAVEEMLLKSQLQNKEISKNLAASSDLVNQYVIRVEQSEKAKDEAQAHLDEYKKEMRSLRDDLETRTKNLKQIEKEYAKAIRNWEEKEAMKEVQHDVGMQTENIESIQSNDFSPVVDKCEKCTLITEQDIDEKCFEHVSVQTDYQGNIFLSLDKSYEVPSESSVQFSHVLASDTLAVVRGNNAGVHSSCTNTDEFKRDKRHLSETEGEKVASYENNICNRTQMSLICGSMIDSVHLQKPIDEHNMPDQGDDCTNFKMAEEYAAKNVKDGLYNKKATPRENEVTKLSEKHTEDCDRCVDNTNSQVVMNTPKAVKRQYEEANIPPAIGSKKRMCERKPLKSSDNIEYCCNPEKHSDCGKNLQNVGSSGAVEPYIGVTKESIHCTFSCPHETKDFLPSRDLKDCDYLLTPLKQFVTSYTTGSKKDDCKGEVSQLSEVTKPTEDPRKNTVDPTNVPNSSSYSDVLGEEKIVNKHGDNYVETSCSDVASANHEADEEPSPRDVILSWDIEINEGTFSQDEKLGCEENNSAAAEQTCTSQNETEYMGTAPRISSITTDESQTLGSGTSRKNGDDRFCATKQTMTFGKSGSCGEKDCLFLKSPVLSGEEGKGDASSDRVSQISGTETCEKTIDDLDNVINVIPVEQKTVKRQLESDDAEAPSICSKKHDSGKSKVFHHNVECMLSPEKYSDCLENRLYLSIQPTATPQETIVSGNKQSPSKTNTHATCYEENTGVKFSIAPGSASPFEETHTEKGSVCSENKITPLNNSKQHSKAHEKCIDAEEDSFNMRFHHEIVGECTETDDKIDRESAAHNKNLDSGEIKASVGIDSSTNHSEFTKNSQAVKERVDANVKTTFHCKKQLPSKTVTYPLTGRSKAPKYNFKPPILKNPGERGTLFETNKNRSIFNKNETSQLSGIESFGKNRDSCSSNQKGVPSTDANFGVESEQKMIKGQCSAVNTVIAAPGKNPSGDEVFQTRNKISGKEEESHFGYRCSQCHEAPSGDINSPLTADQNMAATCKRKVTKRDESAVTVVDASDERFMSDKNELLQHADMIQNASLSPEHVDCEGNRFRVNIIPSVSETPKIYSVEISASEVLRSNNETSSCPLLKTPVHHSDVEKENVCENNENKVPLVNNTKKHIESSEKTVDSLENVVGTVNVISISNIPKTEKKDENKSCILKDIAGHTCSVGESTENVSNQQNMSSVAENAFDRTNANTIQYSKNQVCSQVLSEEKTFSYATEASQISEGSRKLTGSLGGSLNMCKYLETTIRSHLSAAYMGATATDKTCVSEEESKLLKDKNVLGNSSFPKGHIDCVGTMRNISISSTATVETKVIERHFVETKHETVLCGQKQVPDGTLASHSNVRSSYCSFKAPILKFSAMTGIVAGAYDRNPKQNYLSNRNEVPKFLVAEKSVEKPDGTGETVLKTNTCSMGLIQQSTPKKSDEAISETTFQDKLLGESKQSDTVVSICSPGKQINCTINMSAVSSQSTDGTSDISEKDKISSGGPETSNKAEVLITCPETETNLLKTPFVKYPAMLSTLSSGLKEKEVTSNSSFPISSATSHRM